uniref:Fe2OG dioxygenase domain-containing protein n=1 Tax=Attheya septentrionalis TaxID=420275 RepID=A0A7S2UAB3_9STRA|mmetsp:Transcript_16552/g.30115  ORF Transcript_16552/g.30115 Transcript_16552/m.30115 type:complete len:480 (+) Transcript_16552:139-1578(+)
MSFIYPKPPSRIITMLIVLSGAACCQSFLLNIPQNHGWGQQRVVSLTECYAKANVKKNKAKKNTSVPASGGFGAKPTESSSSKTKKVEDDYALFPPLVDSVKETLVPSPESLSNGSGEELVPEVYDRIAQIYGYEHFNYADGVNPFEEAAASAEESGSMSMESLLSTSPSEETSSSSGSLLASEFGLAPSSGGGQSDFADLLASATGVSKKKPPVSIPAPPAQVSVSSIASLKPFSKFRVLHVDPMVLCVDDFFTPEECDALIARSTTTVITADNNEKEGTTLLPMKIGQSKTVGKDSRARAQRTSTTWFHHYAGVPELMAKACRLMGINDISAFEEPQTVRYRRTEHFTWHLDALAPTPELADKGGQRCATLLVYLTDLSEKDGGATMFRDLGGSDGEPLKVRPKKGSALLFFPAAGGIPSVPLDLRTLHCGEAVASDAEQDKWIAQLWLRETPYTPTAPPGNSHASASSPISDYCAN